VPLEIWQQSSEDVHERWRDIARTLREAGDAEAVPRALQRCFWFGVEAVRPRRGARTGMTLRLLLPPEAIEKAATPPSALPGPEGEPRRPTSPRS
jgi:hypothetical protein